MSVRTETIRLEGWASPASRILLGAAILCAIIAAMLTPVIARGAETIAIPRGAIWKYNDTGTDFNVGCPGPDCWRDPFYADFSWSFGAAPLGYGDPSIVTTVSYGADPDHKQPTTYFRRAFSVGVNPATIHSFFLDANYNDGFVAYLNGVEVARRSMSDGPITYDSLAFNHPPGVFEPIDLSAAIPLLAQGANYFAVELHQDSLNSPNLLWDGSLRYSGLPSVTRGPYLQVGTASSVIVRWRTNIATDSRVRYGATQGSLGSVINDGTQTFEHEVAISGLGADTRYYYTVGTSTDILEGDDAGHSFLTSPAAGIQKPTRIWAIGDFGTGSTAQRQVRDAYATYTGSRGTDLWLMLGDNAYVSGSDGEYQTNVFNVYTSLMKTQVSWPARGNHDNVFGGPGNDYYDFFTMPTAGEAGGIASGTEAYYSIDYSNIHLICLDSEGSDRSPGGAMLTWLQNDLAATDKDWIIAYWHHPPYTHGSHNSDNPGDSEGKMRDMRENALPILDQGGVDLILSGHSHDYERSMLLDGHYGYSYTLTSAMKVDSGNGRPDGTGAYKKPHLGEAPHEGAVYVVAGSSGGRNEGQTGALDHPAMVMSRWDYGSVVVDVDALRLDAHFLDNTGALLDSFTIVKGTLLGAPGGIASRPNATLSPARPNPFASRSTLSYSIAARGPVRISIHDLSGRRMKTLVDGVREPGSHQVAWDGTNEQGRRLGAGVYLGVLEFAGRKTSQRLILIR